MKRISFSNNSASRWKLRAALGSMLLVTWCSIGVAQTGEILTDSFEDPNAPEPPTEPEMVVSFYARPSIINAGEEVTFFWESQNAAACETSLGNEPWQALLPSPNVPGEATLAVEALPATFRFTCESVAGGQVSRDSNIVELMPTLNSCEEPADVEVGIIEPWDTVFVSDGFPEINQAVDDHFIGRNNYFAVEFTTTNANVSGAIATVALSGGVRNVSISECPGNFITDTSTRCQQLQGIGEALQYSTDPAGTRCVLEKNRRYFINVTYADVTDRLPNETSTCNTRECLVRMQVSAKTQ
jgi:hypothetical protein